MLAQLLTRYEPPMAFKVVVSDRVIFRIESTIHYIENVYSNRQYAKRLYEAIVESVLELEAKDGFHIRDQEASLLLGQDVNRIKIGKYKLLYVINDETCVVTVFSFFHESQSFENIILYDFKNA